MPANVRGSAYHWNPSITAALPAITILMTPTVPNAVITTVARSPLGPRPGVLRPVSVTSVTTFVHRCGYIGVRYDSNASGVLRRHRAGGSAATATSEGRWSLAAVPKLDDDDYLRLLEFRTAIRKFLKYSKTQAERLGLTATQHQLLLAVRGHQEGPPTIGEVAECLLIKHHSAVELVDRAEAAGLVRRRQDPKDHRIVRIDLTRSGASKLERISAANVAEISRLGAGFQDVRAVIDRLAD